MSRIICLIVAVTLLDATCGFAQDAESPPPVSVAGDAVEVVAEVEEVDPPRDPNPLIDFIIRADENVKLIGEVLLDGPALMVNQIDKNELRLAFKGMADPIVERDFKFVRMICKPDEAQQKLLDAAQSKVRKRMVDALVDWQMRSLTAVDADEELNANPYGTLKWDFDGEIRTSVKEILTPEQLEQLEAEWKKRHEFFRRYLTQVVVAELDDAVLLSPEQRAGVQRRIAAQYQDSWLTSSRFGESSGNALGLIPEQIFLDLLTENQKVVWKNRPTEDVGGFDVFVDEVVDLDVEVEMIEPIKLPDVELPDEE